MAVIRDFEVIIVGGSYAGLSAALSLGRSLRSVLVIDSGDPCNKQTPHSHNFLTQDGRTPQEILDRAKEQVETYETVTFYKGLAISGTKTEHGFEITTDTKDRFFAKKLIFATGIKDTIPPVEGFAACWGISIIHCPYCHGYEHRNKKTAIYANGTKAFHLASVVYNLARDITILTSGEADFTSAQHETLTSHGIQIVETGITAFAHQDGYLQQVAFTDNTSISFDAVYAALPFSQHSDIPVSLGCTLSEHGHIEVDDYHRTGVEGLYVCGDNSNGLRSVAQAVYSGNLTGAVVNGALSDEAF